MVQKSKEDTGIRSVCAGKEALPDTGREITKSCLCQKWGVQPKVHPKHLSQMAFLRLESHKIFLLISA